MFKLKIFTFVILLSANLSLSATSLQRYLIEDKTEQTTTQKELFVQFHNDKVIKYYPELNVIDIWLRERNDTLSKTRYFLSENKAVYYGFTELRMLNEVYDWNNLGALGNRNIYYMLTPIYSDDKTAKFSGLVGTMQVNALLDRKDLNPLHLTIEDGLNKTTIKRSPTTTEPEAFQLQTNQFELYDFSDLGDLEYDPFVIRAFKEGLLERRDLSLNDSLHVH